MTTDPEERQTFAQGWRYFLDGFALRRSFWWFGGFMMANALAQLVGALLGDAVHALTGW